MTMKSPIEDLPARSTVMISSALASSSHPTTSLRSSAVAAATGLWEAFAAGEAPFWAAPVDVGMCGSVVLSVAVAKANPTSGAFGLVQHQPPQDKVRGRARQPATCAID